MFGLSAKTCRAFVLGLTAVLFVSPIVERLKLTDVLAQTLRMPAIQKIKNMRDHKSLYASVPVLFQHQDLRWETVGLDQGKIKLKVLSHEPDLTLTQAGLGAEYFTYSGYLFEQMAAQVKDKSLSTRLTAMANQAKQMGTLVRGTANNWFDGTPTTNMSHLKVRAKILANLNELNQRSVMQIYYNQHGDIMETPFKGSLDQSKTNQTSAMAKFLNAAQQLREEASMHQYSDMKNVVDTHVRLISTLGQNLELRWENTYYCPKSDTDINSCHTTPTNTKIYTIQKPLNNKLALFTAEHQPKLAYNKIR
ncbi:MAG: hypothetical protein KTR14_11600 [Vampirovibrio sp.]|nr:hypothetical protein [Vampirovibrio sp.]